MNTEIAFFVLILYLYLFLDLYIMLAKFLHPNEKNTKKERRSWTDYQEENIIEQNPLRMDMKTMKENTVLGKQLVPLQCSYRDGVQVTPVNKVRQCGRSWSHYVFKRWWTNYWVKMKEKTKTFFGLNLSLALGFINRRPSLLHNSRPWHFLVTGNQVTLKMWCLFAQHLSFTVFIYFKINYLMLIFHPRTFLVQEPTRRSKGAIFPWPDCRKISLVNIVWSGLKWNKEPGLTVQLWGLIYRDLRWFAKHGKSCDRCSFKYRQYTGK